VHFVKDETENTGIPREKHGRSPVTERKRRRMVALSVSWLQKEMRGRYDRICPLCLYEGPFAPYRERVDSRCPSCDSRSHHRLFMLWLDKVQPVGRDAKLLHFAPETGLVPILKGLTSNYKSADMNPKRGDLVLDITDIALPEASQDIIICHQVIEHVDDRKALSEMYRILVPGGVLVLTTPVEEGWAKTYENPEALTRRDRQLYHGQGDHVRFYGRDLRDRITTAGFTLNEFVAEEPLVSLHALERGTRLFICTKPLNVPSGRTKKTRGTDA
jgi:SAM-dependent methyltransferase